MSRDGAAVFAHYLALQIPGVLAAGAVLWMLVDWGQLTRPVAALLFGLWCLKELAMFPVTRIAYERESARLVGADALVGAPGTAAGEIRAGEVGRARVGAELWKARLVDGAPALAEGEPLRVAAVDGLTLRVEPSS